MLGYSRTCSAKSAAPPVRRIRRLTTIESIGRRMKRSVKRILPDSCLDQARHLDLSAGLNAKLALRHDDVARLQATGANDTVTDTPAGRDRDSLGLATGAPIAATDRTSVVSGKSVSVRVDLGGRRVITNTTKIKYN